MLGGFPFANGRYSEVIDFNNDNSVCSKLSNTPYDFHSGTGGLIKDNVPIACGGFHYDGSSNYIDKCFVPGTSTSFTMATKRAGVSSIVHDGKVSFKMY